eukprot:snap_masked-scaffold_3-processed-gene-13.33-mRNA-1 protein AED:1.00 eAED:1.00 QI:0/-1/0/0/-1/1/1/0/63
MYSKQFDESLRRKFQDTELETEEMDYIQLTKAIREVVEELITSKKRKGFHRKNSPGTFELIKL